MPNAKTTRTTMTSAIKYYLNRADNLFSSLHFSWTTGQQQQEKE